MPSSPDELVVTITADISRFRAAMARALGYGPGTRPIRFLTGLSIARHRSRVVTRRKQRARW